MKTLILLSLICNLISMINAVINKEYYEAIAWFVASLWTINAGIWYYEYKSNNK